MDTLERKKRLSIALKDRASRRDVLGSAPAAVAGIAGAVVAVPSAASAPMPEPDQEPWATSEQLLRHRELFKMRNLLLPGTYEMTGEDKHVLGRTVDIEPIGLWASSLVFRSFNGYDRVERWARLSPEEWEADRAAAWARLKSELLPPKERSYMQQIEDEIRATAKPFADANPGIELDVWLDSATDNFICKAYHLAEHCGAAYAITRKSVAEGTYVADAIKSWEGLIGVMTQDPIDDQYRSRHGRSPPEAPARTASLPRVDLREDKTYAAANRAMDDCFRRDVS